MFDLPNFYAKNVSMKFVGIKTSKFDFDTFIFMWSSLGVNGSNKNTIEGTKLMYEIMLASSRLSFATSCHYHLSFSYFIIKQCRWFFT